MRGGAALPAALLALAMTSAMAVGGAYVARRHVASARAAGASAGLLLSAERRLVGALAAWDSASRAAQAVGESVELPSSPADARVWITRTNETQYWIVSESRTTSVPAMHARVAVVIVLDGGRPRVAFPRGWSQIP
jgi:hypothetical protein